MGKIVVIINKVMPYFQVTKFILYTSILDFAVWAHFWSLKKAAGCGRRYFKVIAAIFSVQHAVSMNRDQTATLAPIRKANQNPIQLSPPILQSKSQNIKEDHTLSNMPIVFAHYSNSNYLKFSLSQAKHSNPESTIYLIGDEQNDCYDFVEHQFFSDYFQGANDFSRIYRHFNTTPYIHELFCFQRWFVLHEFLVNNNIEKCLYLDSDTMLFSDVTEEQKKFEQFDFTLSYKTSGCTFFLNRVEALAEFCQFLIDIYSKKERYYYDRMLAQRATFKKNGMAGGACDMTAFDLYSYDHFGEIGEVAQIINGSVFDPSINVQHPGFEMEDGIKKIIWKGCEPYGIHLKTSKKIKFNSLQFQGETKHLIGRYYTGTPIKSIHSNLYGKLA